MNQKQLIERYKLAFEKPKDEFLPYVESLLKEGLDPNFVVGSLETYPYDTLMDTWYFQQIFVNYHESRIGFEFMKLFIKYGYDVHRYDGHFGAQLLFNLEFFPMDATLVEATDFLLQHGVNPEAMSDYRTAIFDLDETAGDGRLCGWYYLANSSEVVARICHRYLDGKPYDGIATYQRYLGKKVRRIRHSGSCRNFKPVTLKDLVEYTTLLIEFENEEAPMLFVFGQTVVIDPYWDTPYWKHYREDWSHWRTIDVVEESYLFDKYIGQSFIGVRMEDRDGVGEEGIELQFTNGFTLGTIERRGF